MRIRNTKNLETPEIAEILKHKGYDAIFQKFFADKRILVRDGKFKCMIRTNADDIFIVAHPGFIFYLPLMLVLGTILFLLKSNEIEFSRIAVIIGTFLIILAYQIGYGKLPFVKRKIEKIAEDLEL